MRTPKLHNVTKTKKCGACGNVQITAYEPEVRERLIKVYEGHICECKYRDYFHEVNIKNIIEDVD